VFTGEYKTEEAQQLIIYAAFTFKARAFHLPKTPLVHDFEDGSRKPISAVVPVTFGLLKKGWKLPRRLDLGVPVYGPPVQPGDVINGQFSLDVVSGRWKIEPGEYLLYLFMDGLIMGPKVLQVT